MRGDLMTGAENKISKVLWVRCGMAVEQPLNFPACFTPAFSIYFVYSSLIIHRKRAMIMQELEDQAAEPKPSRNAEMSPLIKKIIEVAQQHEYIPKEEFLFVPELRPYQEKILDFICTYISKDMKAVGLDEEQMLGVFKFVFGRGWDSVYQWHKKPDGKIENVVTVGGNLLPGDVFLQLPDDIRYAINNSDAPRIIYGIMASWWEENQNDLRSKGIDIWSPLTVALSATFGVAVSMALKTFGYGK
jgi:hypothetical protein